MKHTLLLALLAFLTPFISCSHDDTQDNDLTAGGTGQHNDEAESRPFTFTIQGDFDNPAFLKSALSTDGVELTDMWVIDYKDDEIKQQLHQTSADADWGAPTMNLTLGTHHIFFLASRGQNPTYTNGIVTWTRPNDTFYLDYEVTVVKTSNGNRAVTLERIGTKLSLVIEDAIPAGTTSVTIAPDTWYTGWNMLTGAPVAGEDYAAQYNLPGSWIGGKNSTLNMWGLSTTDEWQTDVAITSSTATETNATATILSAPFTANRASVYRGNLYTNNESNSVSLSTEWLPAYEDVY